MEVRSQAGGARRKYEVTAKRTSSMPKGGPGSQTSWARFFAKPPSVRVAHEDVFERGGVEAVLAEISQLDSDHLAHRYYRTLLAESPDAATARRVAEQAKKDLGSDHELAGLVVEIVEKQPANEEVLLACVRSTHAIGSDHEHRRALESILDPGRPTPAVLVALFESASKIGSDHELAQLLVRALEGRRLDAALAPSFFEAASGIGSDHESATCLPPC